MFGGRKRPKPLAVSNPPLKWWSQSADLAYTTLKALDNSAEAYPLLKSVTGAAISIWDIVEHVREAKVDARRIAIKIADTLETLANVIDHDPDIIPAPVLEDVQRLQILLIEILLEMKRFDTYSMFYRLAHLRTHKRYLRDREDRLSSIKENFLLTAAIQIESKLCNVQTHVEDISTKMGSIRVAVRFHSVVLFPRWVD